MMAKNIRRVSTELDANDCFCIAVMVGYHRMFGLIRPEHLEKNDTMMTVEPDGLYRTFRGTDRPIWSVAVEDGPEGIPARNEVAEAAAKWLRRVYYDHP